MLREVLEKIAAELRGAGAAMSRWVDRRLEPSSQDAALPSSDIFNWRDFDAGPCGLEGDTAHQAG